jgi:hypothetical protein
MLFIVKNSVSIVSFLLFLKKQFFHGSSFTMSASTANIAKKKAIASLPKNVVEYRMGDGKKSTYIKVRSTSKIPHQAMKPYFRNYRPSSFTPGI